MHKAETSLHKRLRKQSQVLRGGLRRGHCLLCSCLDGLCVHHVKDQRREGRPKGIVEACNVLLLSHTTIDMVPCCCESLCCRPADAC